MDHGGVMQKMTVEMAVMKLIAQVSWKEGEGEGKMGGGTGKEDQLPNRQFTYSKTPHVVTVLWQDSDDVVTILSPTRNLYSDCLQRESNFLASTRPVTVLCVCVCCIVCTCDCVMVIR